MRFWNAGGLFVEERGATLALDDAELLARVAAEAGESDWRLPAPSGSSAAERREDPSPTCA